MKWVKRIGLTVMLLPVLLIMSVIAYEIFGMAMNHKATDRQTGKLQADLKNEIEDMEIQKVYSETGNTSGTGNHVECLSIITFSTGMAEEEIKGRMSEHYAFDGWDCYIELEEDGSYTFYLRSSAPFPNNIAGH